MDEVPEDREGAGGRVLERERDGIANTETHAEIGRSQDEHLASINRVLYIVKFGPQVWCCTEPGSDIYLPERNTHRSLFCWSPTNRAPSIVGPVLDTDASRSLCISSKPVWFTLWSD